MEYIDSAYGKLYLPQDKADCFINIAGKHLENMLKELIENNIIPCSISLEKTSVYEKCCLE